MDLIDDSKESNLVESASDCEKGQSELLPAQGNILIQSLNLAGESLSDSAGGRERPLERKPNARSAAKFQGETIQYEIAK